MTVDVTVILLTYDHEPYVADAIESVLAQRTSASFEVIISEDRSTDRTRDIVTAFQRHHPDRIRLLLSERNRNDQEVFARAWRGASGEFVAYLDGDDYWLPDKLQDQLDFMRAHPVCPLSFHAVELVKDEQIVGRLGHDRPWVTKHEQAAWDRLCSVSMMVRRESVGDLPGWYADLPYSDWPLTLIAAQRGDIGYLDRTLAGYREHAAGYWTGAGIRRQATMDITCLTAVRTHLPALRASASFSLAHRRFRLARATAAEGDRSTATRELGRGLAEATRGLVSLRSPREIATIRSFLPTRRQLRQRLAAMVRQVPGVLRIRDAIRARKPGRSL